MMSQYGDDEEMSDAVKAQMLDLAQKHYFGGENQQYKEPKVDRMPVFYPQYVGAYPDENEIIHRDIKDVRGRVVKKLRIANGQKEVIWSKNQPRHLSEKANLTAYSVDDTSSLESKIKTAY